MFYNLEIRFFLKEKKKTQKIFSSINKRKQCLLFEIESDTAAANEFKDPVVNVAADAIVAGGGVAETQRDHANDRVGWQILELFRAGRARGAVTWLDVTGSGGDVDGKRIEFLECGERIHAGARRREVEATVVEVLRIAARQVDVKVEIELAHVVGAVRCDKQIGRRALKIAHTLEEELLNNELVLGIGCIDWRNVDAAVADRRLISAQFERRGRVKVAIKQESGLTVTIDSNSGVFALLGQRDGLRCADAFDTTLGGLGSSSGGSFGSGLSGKRFCRRQRR